MTTQTDTLRKALEVARQYVKLQNRAEGIFEGFGGRKPRPSDADLQMIDEALLAASPQPALHQSGCDLLKPPVIEHDGEKIAVFRACDCSQPAPQEQQERDHIPDATKMVAKPADEKGPPPLPRGNLSAILHEAATNPNYQRADYSRWLMEASDALHAINKWAEGRAKPAEQQAPAGEVPAYRTIITISSVNNGGHWHASSNKSNRVAVSQRTPEEALRLALQDAGHVAPTSDARRKAALWDFFNGCLRSRSGIELSNEHDCQQAAHQWAEAHEIKCNYQALKAEADKRQAQTVVIHAATLSTPPAVLPKGWQDIIQSQYQKLEGTETNQTGWHRRNGWNDALRHIARIFNALSAAPAAPQGEQP